MLRNRREIIGAMAASGAVLASTTGARANPVPIDLAQIKKETDIACLYHCDFGDPQRFSQMLQNMLNHYSAYEFDTFKLKLVVVAHGAGIKFFLEDRTGTPWEKDNIDPRALPAIRRTDQVRRRGIPVPDHLQAPEHRSGQDPQGRVSQIRAVRGRDRRRAASQGLRLSQGRVKRGHRASDQLIASVLPGCPRMS